MRFRAVTLFSFALATLLCGCGEQQRELARQDYEGWSHKVSTPVTINPALLDGLWMLGAESFLYSDKYDSRYDSASGRRPETSGEVLLIHGNRLTRGQIPLWCPLPPDSNSAKWMVDLGYKKGDVENSLALNMAAFVAAAETRGPQDRWDTFGLAGQEFATGKKLRGIGDKPGAPRIHYRMRITELTPDRLEITYTHPGPFDGGVHTIIEIYKPLSARHFVDMLKQSDELKKPCK
jgi:hypothetical protein